MTVIGPDHPEHPVQDTISKALGKPTAEVEHCDVCGCCETPNECVWSHECPKCGAGVGEQCRNGNRLEKLHDERWALVRDG